MKSILFAPLHTRSIFVSKQLSLETIHHNFNLQSSVSSKMPELGDNMYCSEQIFIPPTFPYLLRQFAKAAIRTQPQDLLRWSTAYFRCLALNVPPPVKPRLEYPLPRTYEGITPGWLRALIHQMKGFNTVNFKVLWDRWIGACLEHKTLIQMLCMARFTDPLAIPWLQFVAVCTAHLTNNLTETMVQICEILTEEPEGGSAMIPLEIFLDIYQFLAPIDASHSVTVKNLHFSESLLNLWREKVEKFEKEEAQEETVTAESSSSVSEVVEQVEEEEKVADDAETISCPSLGPEDYKPEQLDSLHVGDIEVEPEELLEEASKEEEEEEEGEEENSKDHEINIDEILGGSEPGSEIGEHEVEIFSVSRDQLAEQEGDISLDLPPEPVVVAQPVEEEKINETEKMTSEESLESFVSAAQEPHVITLPTEEEKALHEDLEKLRVLQEEMKGETDEEVEKFKCRLIEDMPLDEEKKEAVEHFEVKEEVQGEDVEEKEVKIKTESGEAVSEGEGEVVVLPVVPGISGRVPKKMIDAVVEFMKKTACLQKGMVMPRNFRNVNCPPLEEVNDFDG